VLYRAEAWATGTVIERLKEDFYTDRRIQDEVPRINEVRSKLGHARRKIHHHTYKALRKASNPAGTAFVSQDGN